MGSLRRFNLRPLIPHGYNRLVETGSGRGQSIDYALRQGLSRVDSVDATPHCYEWCREIFTKNPNVHLTLGRSLEFLRDISDYRNTVVFLDAHFVGGPDFQIITHEESIKYPDSFPLLDELRELLNKDVSSAVIIIDDMRMWFADAGQKGPVPEFGQRYHELPQLLALTDRFRPTHRIVRVSMDEGYMLLMPNGLQLHHDRLITLDNMEKKKIREHEVSWGELDLGIEMIRNRRYDKALQYYKAQSGGHPYDVYWLQRYANVLFITEHHREALKAINRVVNMDPNNADARWLEGSIYLSLGDWDNAWPRMENRINSVNAEAYGIREQDKPMWHGQPSDKPIYVWREQGFGDSIQMLRYLNLIKQPFVCEIDHALMRLARSSFPDVNFMFIGDDVPDHDYQISLQSLPYFFKTNQNNVPKPPYLKTSKALMQKWRDYFNTERNLPPGSKIGICWEGSSILRREIQRSIPFDLLAPIADDYTFVSLQHSEGIFQDFADTAACMMNLDLILSIDTSVAHLAGALGVPIWLMLPIGGDARWMLGREDSPWYPSMRIVRQRTACDWSELIRRVRNDLHRVIPPRIIPASKFVA